MSDRGGWFARGGVRSPSSWRTLTSGLFVGWGWGWFAREGVRSPSSWRTRTSGLWAESPDFDGFIGTATNDRATVRADAH
jgi:hypothetical protein